MLSLVRNRNARRKGPRRSGESRTGHQGEPTGSGTPMAANIEDITPPVQAGPHPSGRTGRENARQDPGATAAHRTAARKLRRRNAVSRPQPWLVNQDHHRREGDPETEMTRAAEPRETVRFQDPDRLRRLPPTPQPPPRNPGARPAHPIRKPRMSPNTPRSSSPPKRTHG